MRMKIKAKKVDGGYVMIAVGNNKIEYPRDNVIYDTRSEVYKDAAIMYACSVWEYNEITHTIKID